VTAGDGTSQAYMHMLRKPVVKAGQRVEAGAAVGSVGESGSAQGCHLHFELWTAPGWYRGGQPIDPLPSLKKWEAGG
jgi:murein DD-endopeptidase MepM/ murein hydrolase activator NlpD